MKVKGGRRKSWEGLPESASMAEDISLTETNPQNAPLFFNVSFTAPPLLSLDSQQQQHQHNHEPPPQAPPPPPAATPPQPPLQPNDFNVETVNFQPEPEAEDSQEPDEDDAVEEEEEEAEEEEVEDEADDANDEADENAERPKLDEGFFEIEAIRRKRVRRGQLQYLIKWRGWAETANTWEPIENLQSCSDVIESFEESLLSGKKKRKRRGGLFHTHVKKRHQANPFAVSGKKNNKRSENRGKKHPSAITNNAGTTDLSGYPKSSDHPPQDCNGDTNTNKNGESSKRGRVENGRSTSLRRRSSGRRFGAKDYDPKLSELKTIPVTVSGADKLETQYQEAKASEGNGLAAEGTPKAPPQTADSVQGSTRSIGAKRRKSGSVKRFKQEPQPYGPSVVENVEIGKAFVSGARMGVREEGYLSMGGGENPRHWSSSDPPENPLHITKILKAIGYSASVVGDVQDVKVNFSVLRSDGVEMMVDNKFLKSNNPQLLINFYEQNLRYDPTS